MRERVRGGGAAAERKAAAAWNLTAMGGSIIIIIDCVWLFWLVENIIYERSIVL